MECIDALLRAGADRGIHDMNGKTALDTAIEAGREECARALKLEIGDAKVCMCLMGTPNAIDDFLLDR